MELTQELLKELLHYEPDTGHLFWKKRSIKHFPSERVMKIWNSRFSEARAGCEFAKKSQPNYASRNISILNHRFEEHRVIWIMMTGEKPASSIDHINRDATDNRWQNLRLSKGMNSFNLSKNPRNTSGFSGVSKTPYGWTGEVSAKGKRYRKTFKEKSLAISFVEKVRKREGFDPDHGKHYSKLFIQSSTSQENTTD